MGRGLDKPGMGGSGKCEPRGAKGLPVLLPKLDQGKVVEGSNCWWPLAGGVGRRLGSYNGRRFSVQNSAFYIQHKIFQPTSSKMNVIIWVWQTIPIPTKQRVKKAIFID